MLHELYGWRRGKNQGECGVAVLNFGSSSNFETTDSAVRLPAELLAKCSRADGALTHCQDLRRVMSRHAKRVQKLWRSVFTSEAGIRSYWWLTTFQFQVGKARWLPSFLLFALLANISLWEFACEDACTGKICPILSAWLISQRKNQRWLVKGVTCSFNSAFLAAILDCKLKFLRILNWISDDVAKSDF